MESENRTNVIPSLLPCPFCGGEAENRWRYRRPGEDACYWVLCPGCGSTSAAYGSEAEAVEVWNTRSERTCRLVQSDTVESLLADFQLDTLDSQGERMGEVIDTEEWVRVLERSVEEYAERIRKAMKYEKD